MAVWHNMSFQDVAKELKVSSEKGLSEKDASKRLSQYGHNVLIQKKKKPIFIKFLEQFKDFMIITLIFAAGISFLVSFANGEIDFVDPVIILFIIILNALLGVIQELKAERSLESLKKLATPNATVKREGTICIIPSSDLVPGDIILLETGHIIPADARLMESINLKIEESSLTGESHPIDKNADCILSKSTLLADRKNMVMATSMVCYGRGMAIVTNTGMKTEVGHIAKLIMEDDTPETPLQKRLSSTGKTLGIAAMIICVLIFIVGIYKNRPIFDMFMTSVSLAVAAIPEGLPAIVTIMLSLGVQRMAKKNAVIRKLPAVETLGSATVICSDKTGTLTQNKMTVTQLSSLSGLEDMDSSYAHFLLSLAVMCNDSKISNSAAPSIVGEPTENALVLAANSIGIIKSKLDLYHKRVSEIPFDSSRKLMTTIHRMETGFRIVTKGAPDILVPRCSHYFDHEKITPLTDIKSRFIMNQNDQLASKSLRVIGIAYQDTQHIPTGAPSSIENRMIFVGLIGMMDPPRKEVRESVLECKRAGIRTVMITGDHISTACAIAEELGILYHTTQSLTGQELSLMNDDELQRNIHKYTVFARVSPQHKVRIVKALQHNGEVVAMTGDGVNDAPALKCADIGCAMGISGTDVAKNAADMILTDDNFTTIVAAVKEGRGIYDNIKKSVHFLLSCNIGEIMTIFTAIVMGLPSPLLPVQLLWVNLVTDSLPAISLGVEPPEKNIMKRPPIPPNKGMFSDGLVYKILVEGMLIGSLALIAYLIGLRSVSDGTTTLASTMCFAVLSLSQLFHSFNMRSSSSILTVGLFRNKKLILSFVVCAILQIVVINSEQLQPIFNTTSLTKIQWFIVFTLSFLPIPLVELQKFKRSQIHQ